MAIVQSSHTGHFTEKSKETSREEFTAIMEVSEILEEIRHLQVQPCNQGMLHIRLYVERSEVLVIFTLGFFLCSEGLQRLLKQSRKNGDMETQHSYISVPRHQDHINELRGCIRSLIVWLTH